MTTIVDWKKELKRLYFPPTSPVLVDVPPMQFLMIDGHGDPNTSETYQQAVEALFSFSYTLKFAIKKAEGVEYAVFPLEGLWWVPDMADFSVQHKDDWDWTMMIAQPEVVTTEWVERARAETQAKKDLPALAQIRFAEYHEGVSVQLTHIGPYSTEGPNIARLHAWLEVEGYERSGKHHEIYLSDARRTEPHKLKTVLRQPGRKA